MTITVNSFGVGKMGREGADELTPDGSNADLAPQSPPRTRQFVLGLWGINRIDVRRDSRKDY
jgi:hypothetical protein